MKNKIFLTADRAGLLIGATLLAALTGCVAEGPGQSSGYRGHPAVQGQVTVMFSDDYDYYPGYETYYSRTRHEYVYRDGNSWVRRSEPQGVAVNVLLAAPSVRMDFRDSPEQHHSTVVQSYPRNWKGADSKQDVKADRQDNRKDEKKGKKDQKDDNKDDRKDDRR
jgi:hypothetical protein